MNRDELEQWMKDSLGKEEFMPDEAGWDKFRAAINPPAKNDGQKTVLFHLPKGLGIAASVILFITTGTLLYFAGRENKPEIPIIAMNKVQPVLPEEQAPKIIAADQSTKPGNNQADPYRDQKRHNDAFTQTEAVTRLVDLTNDNSISVPVPDDIGTSDQVATETKKVYTQAEKKEQLNPDLFGSQQENEQKIPSSLNFGITAQLGKVSIGNMRYQLGMVARQSISKKFYAEATVALASTEVSFIQKNNFESVTIGASAGSSIGKKSIDAQYGSNILSAGISPAIGYRVTTSLALGCGVAVYHNLNQSVSLRNDAAIEPAALNNKLISETNPVSSWDAGLTGNAAYTIGTKLTINVQYRHGLSTFLYFNNQAVRNSGVNMGLNYLFGK